MNAVQNDNNTSSYLARYASCIFWMSRYLERAENVASLLEVTQSFSPASENAQNWQSVLALHCDEQAFAARYVKLSAANVARFYLSDDTHENSIFANLHLARLNASQLRSVISTEMWVQINTLYNNLRDIAARPISLQELSAVLTRLKNQCQALSGVAEGGLYRDQGWYFYLLGKQLERADQTTRLLDIKYHLLLPSMEAVGSIIDAAQWFALLRAASGYHAFRREYPQQITPSSVAGFLLLSHRFPRSVAACVTAIGYALEQLHNECNVRRMDEIIALNQELLTTLKQESIEKIIALGLHEYLDRLQLHLSRMSDSIGTKFF